MVRGKQAEEARQAGTDDIPPRNRPQRARPVPRWEAAAQGRTFDAERRAARVHRVQRVLDLDELPRRREGGERETVVRVPHSSPQSLLLPFRASCLELRELILCQNHFSFE